MINSERFLFRVLLVACPVAVSSLAATPLWAQIPTHADEVMTAYNSAFLTQTGGQTFYTWGYKQNTVKHVEGSWGQAFSIYPAQDRFEYSHNIADLNIVQATLNSWLTSPSWTGSDAYWDTSSPPGADGWDDNIGWTIEAMMRGYQLTGNQAFLTQAANGWNFVMNGRAGDPSGGGWNSKYGGISETNGTTGNACALSNSNFSYTGVWLYEATGQATYLNGAEAIYAWERQHLVNTTGSTIHASTGTWQPWQVIGCTTDAQGDLNDTGSDNVYDAGGVLFAAVELYRVTGNQQYLNDATGIIGHIVGEYNPTANPPNPPGYNSEDCDCTDNYHFTKGLSDYLTLTSGYWNSANATWLINTAVDAWNERDSFGLTWNQWSKPTTDPTPQSMETVSATAVWQQLPPPAMNLAGTYEIQNVGSNLVVNVDENSADAGAAVIQYPYFNGQTNSLWTFVPTSGGYYQIKNVNSGLVLNVKGGPAGGAGFKGEPIIQWQPQGMIPGNDQWMPVHNADGTYSFYNLESKQALDVPGGSTASLTQLDQWFANGTAAQKFNLIRQN